MSSKEKNPVIMIEDDYRTLRRYVESAPVENEMSLAHELERAIIVRRNAFPSHAIRLNSTVSVMDLKSKRVLEFTIVLPNEADMQQKKISVLTPMGTALFGFRKSEEVKWKFPGGLRKIKILDVVNQAL
jgi:regulator of nucleoside diphosphate kinase